MTDNENASLDQLLHFYEDMLRIRFFEERIRDDLGPRGLIRGSTHLYIGQEAVGVGCMHALQPEDYVLSTHRGHGHALARGCDPEQTFAEILGRKTGQCQGKGGSMHIADMGLSFIGENPVVAGNSTIAAGVAWACKLQQNGRLVAAFNGEGAVNNGAFHEALNMAALWDLPVVFLVENNLYAISVPLDKSASIRDLHHRAEAYGMPGKNVNGMDAVAVYQATKEAAELAREQSRPSLLVFDCYRFEGHYLMETGRYRSVDEVVQYRREHDPIHIVEAGLLEDCILDVDEVAGYRLRIRQEIEEACERAKQAPWPDEQETLTDVYVSVPGPLASPERAGTRGEAQETGAGKAPEEPRTREVVFAQAIRTALAEELKRDERVLVYGEDVGVYGSVYGVTKGLQREFGEERVRDTPISESAIAGMAVGAALMGMRPVAEIMYCDFLTQASDNIVNQGAKLRYMSGGQMSVPMVIRTPGGGGKGNAAQHSQCLEAWMAHIPGLKVVMPSVPRDARGLLKAAIRDPDPVVFIEHKDLYFTKGPMPVEEEVIALGVGDIKREGDACTVVAWSKTLLYALEAADKLAEDGIHIEVVDPRTLQPLDIQLIEQSVRKTRRLLVAHEAVEFGGFGAEIAAQIVQRCWGDLQAPPARLGARFCPLPFSEPLEHHALPQPDDIVAAVRGVVG